MEITTICPMCGNFEVKGPNIGQGTLSFKCPKCGCEWRLYEEITKERFDSINILPETNSITKKFNELNSLRQQLAAANAELASLAAQVGAMKEVLDDIGEDIEYSLNEGRLGSWAPEDLLIKEICEKVGYGAVMDSAARQWGAKDNVGAHTTGPARLILQTRLNKIQTLLSTADTGWVGVRREDLMRVTNKPWCGDYTQDDVNALSRLEKAALKEQP